METENSGPTLPPDLLAKVRQKEIANLLKRVQEGGTMTAAQWARVLEFADAGSGSGKGQATVGNIAALCREIGISRPTFYSIRRKFPKEYPQRAANGSWSVPAWRAFARAKGYTVSSAPGEAEPDAPIQPSEDEKYALEVQVLRWRAKTAGLEFLRMSGQYVHWSEVEKHIAGKMSTIRSRLLAIPNSVAKRCEGKPVVEIYALVDGEIRSALEAQ